MMMKGDFTLGGGHTMQFIDNELLNRTLKAI